MTGNRSSVNGNPSGTTSTYGRVPTNDDQRIQHDDRPHAVTPRREPITLRNRCRNDEEASQGRQGQAVARQAHEPVGHKATGLPQGKRSRGRHTSRSVGWSQGKPVARQAHEPVGRPVTRQAHKASTKESGSQYQGASTKAVARTHRNDA
ncbi:hypothetical protein GCM10010211_56550 [Streptomyces albospinus]|uniref:Uncharacterized protein n=1 Tax=Streptomyces albospinus TaxID=285515 RepID=A0ABQ2VHG2_9ACTN|nr:hypothetical protein GCM10010211_56550 [Streptomyces albospinus]